MEINRLKPFYISLCVFFLVGAFVTAYVNGQQVQTVPDNNWHTPEYFVGYFNNYLNQKVNPMTLGDVMVTEYLENPSEPTGVVPLYPTQAVVQDRTLVNSIITELETYVSTGDNTQYGTTIGIGVYLKEGKRDQWELQKYKTFTTGNEPNKVIKITIETPRIRITDLIMYYKTI